MKPSPAPLRQLAAEDIVFSQGHGTRRECRDLLRGEKVFITEAAQATERVLSLDERLNPVGATLRIGTLALPWLEAVYLMLHKPFGSECSHKPTHHASIFDGLPEPFARRGLEAAGRLDAETTGLLLMSTDGQWLHRLIAPRHNVAKVYRVTHAEPLSDAAAAQLWQGLVLRGESEATLPAEVERLDARTTRLTVFEGRYHQVRRMFAAVGHRVLGLHRERVGQLQLPADLPPGQWRLIDDPQHVF